MIILKRIFVLIVSIGFLASQDKKTEKFHFQFEMDSLELHVGEAKEITIKLFNENGDLAQNPFYVFGQRRALSVSPRMSDSTGVAKVTVNAYKPGRLRLSVQTITVKRDDRIRDGLVVNVPYPPVDHLVFNQTPSKLYTETSTSFSADTVTLRTGFFNTRTLNCSVTPSAVADTVTRPVRFVSRLPKISKSATAVLLDVNSTSTSSRVSPASSITSTEKDVDVSVYSLLGVWLNTR